MVMKNNLQTNLTKFKKMMKSFKENIGILSAEALGWVGVLLVNLATIPTMIAVLAGLTEKGPSVDVVILLWLGLLMFFIKSVITKNVLNIITIGVGFFAQATLLALIVFK